MLAEMLTFLFYFVFHFTAGKYTDEQIRKMNESMQIRQAAEPVELVNQVWFDLFMWSYLMNQFVIYVHLVLMIHIWNPISIGKGNGE